MVRLMPKALDGLAYRRQIDAKLALVLSGTVRSAALQIGAASIAARAGQVQRAVAHLGNAQAALLTVENGLREK